MDLPEAGGDRGAHPPDVDPPIIPKRYPRGLVSPPNVWVAVPFERELGTQQTTLSDVAKGLSRSSRRSPKDLPKSLVTERESSEPGTKSGPEQRPDREVLDGEESDEWVETDEEWVRIHRRPRRDLFSLHDSQGGPTLSDISKRRESIVCSTREWRIVDRWRDKESEKHQHRETCGCDIELNKRRH